MAEEQKTPVISIVAAGEMGSALGARLVKHGAEVRTSVRGRSEATRKRASADGFVSCEDDRELLDGCDFVLSVLPSGSTIAFAERLQPVLTELNHKPVYIECNPIAPQVIKRIGEILATTGCAYVDAGIIGDPPSRTDDRGPRVYVCGDGAGRCLVLRDYGLDVRVLEAPAGAASAIKLSYSALTKGLQGLAVAVFARAEAAGIDDAFRADFSAGQPELTAVLDRFLPRLPAKAGRWVQEMDQLADYFADEPGAGPMYEAIARYYERIAAKNAQR